MRHATLFVCLLLCSRAAHAQSEESDVDVVIRSSRVGEDRRRVESGTAAVTSVDVRDSLERWSATEEILDRLAGVRVRRLGGLGSFSTLSIRGSTAAQVLVLLDGMPLHDAASGTANLAAVPLSALERIDVYRGDAPAGLGPAGPGGVVALWTRQPRESSIRASGTMGSFGTRRLTLLGSAAPSPATASSRLWLSGNLSYEGTDGDYDYYDDAGTELVSSDDVVRVRRNADHRSLTGNLRLGWANPSLRLDASTLASASDTGLPGLGAFPALRARSGQTRALGSLRATFFDLSEALPRLEVHLDALAQQDHIDDPDAELSATARRERSITARATGGATLHAAPSGTLDLRLDAALTRETLSRTALGEPARGRTVVAGAAEARLRLGAVRVVPAVRVDVVTDDDDAGTEISWSPRLGVRQALLSAPILALDLRAHLGVYGRSPTFLELYGDRGVLVGNPDLVPENGVTGDLGLIADLPRRARRGRPRLRAELSVYAVETTDLIVLVQNAQRTAIPRNLSGARVLGLESSVESQIPVSRLVGFRAAGTYGLTASESRERGPTFGRSLPGRPLHELWLRLESRIAFVVLGVDLDVASTAYVDEVELVRTAPRYLLGADVQLRLGPVTITLEARNLLDRIVERVPAIPHTPGTPATLPLPLSDYAGHPLPGRTLSLTVGTGSP
ncbi:MAG: TonB-dependent receptor plug domain-containing protein [Deltaproteobacteria bacterium]|nr:TonB-dependent receptor plug domain-containing protein [Deltaproteobacteria bacterium]